MGSAGFEPTTSSAQGWHPTMLDNDPHSKEKFLSNFNLVSIIIRIIIIFPIILSVFYVPRELYPCRPHSFTST
ncbi:conserved protein of unknown function [Candidatus Nitrosocosmicus franklandus]|uniref:Transmembrane protein n=1 Tax=Candidatus Nitrosocosmicus franklandianus TaxID=1798806 RepID=A0A484IC28_9ARCH|nr:conserved protein of unknown function [Candidatus Nitrosocosmicus franklandus]